MEKKEHIGSVNRFSGADLSQSIDRVPRVREIISGVPPVKVLVCPTILPGTKLWLMHPQTLTVPGSPTQHPDAVPPCDWLKTHTERLLTPYEALMVQGWPVLGTRLFLSQQSANLLMDLAGNAFAGN
eukprot:6479625-Amphidinium_carterae.3